VVAEHHSDRAGTRAHVDRRAVRREQLRRAQRERLGVWTRNVDARVDQNPDAAEHRAAGDPCQRLAGQPARDHRVEFAHAISGGREQLGGLVIRREEAARSEPCGDPRVQCCAFAL
jgi:hypothetical protein